MSASAESRSSRACAGPGGRRSGRRAAPGRREAALGYLLLLPSALLLVAFGFLPLLNAVVLSLRDYRLSPGPFIGLENYRLALLSPTESPEFWRSMGVTLYYVLG